MGGKSNQQLEAKTYQQKYYYQWVWLNNHYKMKSVSAAMFYNVLIQSLVCFSLHAYFYLS